MKNIKKLLSITIMMLFSSLLNLLAIEMTELSYGKTVKINVSEANIEDFQLHLGFKSAQEIRNFLEAIKEFYYHNSVLIEFFASEYCDPVLQRKVQSSLSAFLKYNNELMKIKDNLALKIKMFDLSRAITLMKIKGTTAGDLESENFISRKEFEPSLLYAEHGFPKLKEKLNQFSDTLFTKVDL